MSRITMRWTLCFSAMLLTTTLVAQPVRDMARAPKRHGFTVTAGIDVPLRYEDDETRGEASQGEESFRSPRAALTLRYSPPRTQLFARVTLHRYLDRSRQQPWNPDFTYSFGYEDWRPGTFSLTYDNYTGNRFNPKAGERFTRFDEGTISAIYRIPISERIESIFVPHPDRRLSAAVGLHATPHYTQDATAERGDWKKSVSFTVRNRFYRYWFAEASAYWYPDRNQQQPWDPDFTYSFGYFDWNPGKVSLVYSNYAANRMPGLDSRARGASLLDGSIGVTWSKSW